MRTIRSLKTRLADDAGMTTVEYSVATIGAAGLGGLLIKILTSDEARNLLWSILKSSLTLLGL